ncbi:unnamed protein product, partial [Brassica oleracea]
IYGVVLYFLTVCPFGKEGTHPLENANVVAVQVTTRRPAVTLYKKLRLWRRHLKAVRSFFLGTG